MVATEWVATSVATGMYPVMEISELTVHAIIHLATPEATSHVMATHLVQRGPQRVLIVLLHVPNALQQHVPTEVPHHA